MKKHPQSSVSQSGLTCIEICSGAGGRVIGLERAGFEALAHVEFDRHTCETLRLNRPDWNVVEGDVRDFPAKEFKGEGSARSASGNPRKSQTSSLRN